MPLGYEYGDPFGDPNKFTRSTGESELDRFNQWLRGQDYWQQARSMGEGDFSDAQRDMVINGLKGQGVNVPDHFLIDKGGNLNQTNRLDDALKWSAIAGGAALGGLGLAGIGPLGALGGSSAAGGVLPSTTIGTGYLGPIAGGTGAAVSGGAAGGALAGITLPSEIMGLAGSGFGGASGTAAGTIAGTGATLPSTQIGSGMVSGLPAGGVGTNVAQQAGGSVLSKFLNPDTLGDIGDIGTSLANDEGRIRRDRGNWAQQYDRIRLQGRDDDRAQEKDALKKLVQTGYLKSGGANPLPTRVNSGTLPDLGFGPRPATDAQKQGASTLEGTLLNRLTPEGQFQPTPLESYANPGLMENIGRYTNYGTAVGNVLNETGTLGKIGKGLKNVGKWIGGLF